MDSGGILPSGWDTDDSVGPAVAVEGIAHASEVVIGLTLESGLGTSSSPSSRRSLVSMHGNGKKIVGKNTDNKFNQDRQCPWAWFCC